MCVAINISPLRGELNGFLRSSRGPAVRRLPAVACLLLSAFCLLPSAFGSGWTRQRSGTMAWLYAVHFLDQNHGWVAGSGGTLLETTDGGATWKKVATLTKDTLRDVYFADDRTGWLVADRDVFKLKTNAEPRSYLLTTEDGGLTWRPIFLENLETNARLVRAVFADRESGWVFGESGVVFATRDGGQSWAQQNLPSKHLLLGGAFVDYSHGWLVGAGGTVLQTKNGGATWHSGTVRDGAGVRFTATSFVGDRLGWAVGSAGRIFTTTDGGHMWFAQRSNVEQDLFDVKFVSAAEGWAAGAQGTLLHTFNGGVHWFVEPTGTTHAIERLFVVDRTHVWAVGFGGTILTIGNATGPKLKSE